MNLRYFLDENGNLFLEQQVKIIDPLDSSKIKTVWEKIPIVSSGGNVSEFVEKSKTSFFIFESTGKRMWSDKETLRVEVYSCLSVKSCVEIEGKTRVDFIGRNHFVLDMDIASFIKLLTDMMTRFMIVTIDHYGQIKGVKDA